MATDSDERGVASASKVTAPLAPHVSATPCWKPSLKDWADAVQVHGGVAVAAAIAEKMAGLGVLPAGPSPRVALDAWHERNAAQVCEVSPCRAWLVDRVELARGRCTPCADVPLWAGPR